jgi:hypothetical protein
MDISFLLGLLLLVAFVIIALLLMRALGKRGNLPEMTLGSSAPFEPAGNLVLAHHTGGCSEAAR